MPTPAANSCYAKGPVQATGTAGDYDSHFAGYLINVRKKVSFLTFFGSMPCFYPVAVVKYHEHILWKEAVLCAGSLCFDPL